MSEISPLEVIDSFGAIPADSADILKFWFHETSDFQHFTKDPNFDQLIKERFLPVMQRLYAGLYRDWLQTAGGALAACIAIDQFSRNVFRDTPTAFAHDHLGLEIAQHMRAQNLYVTIPPAWRVFSLLPFMHSEDVADQLCCIKLGKELINNPEFTQFAEAHHRIIARFGRFPHRNQVLGRVPTSKEEAFLQEPNASF